MASISLKKLWYNILPQECECESCGEYNMQIQHSEL